MARAVPSLGRPFPFAVAVALTSAVLLSACQGQANNKPSQAAGVGPINCGEPASLVNYPRDKSWLGLRLGPLFFSAFGPGQDRAVIAGFDRRLPTKVVIQPIDPLNAPTKVEGKRCSNGERLRFEYGASWDTPVAVLPPVGASADGTPVGYTGYMLFTAPGKWVISVSSNDGQLIGSAIVLVQEAPNSTVSDPTPLPTPTDYKQVCLLESSVCSCASQLQDAVCSQSIPASLLRPLRLPQVAPGQVCPTTADHHVSTKDFAGLALGTGPVQPLIAATAIVVPREDGWYEAKTLWFTLPGYVGAVLVRGARIDGQGPVGFGEQPLIGHLIIPPGPTINEGSDGYRQAPGGTFVRAPGCYAWQVDGIDFSYELIFKAMLR